MPCSHVSKRVPKRVTVFTVVTTVVSMFDKGYDGRQEYGDVLEDIFLNQKTPHFPDSFQNANLKFFFFLPKPPSPPRIPGTHEPILPKPRSRSPFSYIQKWKKCTPKTWLYHMASCSLSNMVKWSLVWECRESLSNDGIIRTLVTK